MEGAPQYLKDLLTLIKQETLLLRTWTTYNVFAIGSKPDWEILPPADYLPRDMTLLGELFATIPREVNIDGRIIPPKEAPCALNISALQHHQLPPRS